MMKRVFFVNQPWTEARPPKSGDSIGIWSDRISKYLVEYCSVIYYGKVIEDDERKLGNLLNYRKSKVEYKEIPWNLDNRLKLLTKIATKIDGFVGSLPYFASKKFHWGYGWQIAKDIDSQQSDYNLVHIHNHSQFIEPIRKYNTSAKIIIHMHCEWLNRLDREAIAKRLAKVDLVISCSDYITNKIKQRFPQYAAICKTVNNGVDANYFVPSIGCRTNQTAPQLLFVGRISPEKGIHDLIDAFIKVTVKYPQAVLRIIGSHIVVAKEFLFDLQPEPEVQALRYFYSVDYLEYLKSLVPPHLTSQVIFQEGMLQQQLLPYYQQADVVINPSLSEAFGMSLVEAMATATPVVATTIGGMTEIVDNGVNGLLTAPGNTIELSEAICSIIDNPQKAQAMGKAGRSKVLRRYSWQKIADSLMDCYADIGVNLRSNVTEKTVA